MASVRYFEIDVFLHVCFWSCYV